MTLKKSCVVFAAALLAAAVVFSPNVCRAGLFDCFRSSTPAPTTYAPPYQAQRVAYMPSCDPCNACAAPQVSYVPEVKYRWTYSRIDRTEYQPVASADPCTGCPVTTYRPVTTKSLLPWLHREAYTTYRAVPYGAAMPVSYMQPTYQAGYCNPCATCAPGGSACSSCGSACSSCGSACSSCGSACDSCGSAAMAAPSLSSSCPSCAGGTTVYPDNAASDSGYSQQTFQSGSDWGPVAPEKETRLKPTPDKGTQEPEGATNKPTAMPRMVIPSLPDKTASVSRVRTVSFEEPTLNMTGNLQEAATIIVPLRLVPVE